MLKSNDELLILSNALYWYIDKWENSDIGKISKDLQQDIKIAKQIKCRFDSLTKAGGLYKGEL